MGDIVQLIGLLKDAPATVTLFLVVITVLTTVYLKHKKNDLEGVITVSNAQNEKLKSLMEQNDQLLHSIETLQKQVMSLNTKLTQQAEEHQEKLVQMYKIIDEMRTKIMELEDMVRKYQTSIDHCGKIGCKNRIN